jgi:hypothetical protein
MKINKTFYTLIFSLSTLCSFGCEKPSTKSSKVDPIPKRDILRVWNVRSIEKAKTEKNDATLRIISDADKYLTMTMASVMDKPMTPPSGDKHDYISTSRYWWPNPNTPDGLPYIRKDGQVNPEIEKFDKMPMERLIKSIYALSLAYYISGSEKYAEKAVNNLKLWFINKETKMNPHLNYGQFIPGRNENKGEPGGIIETYGMVEMLDGVNLLKRSSKYSKEVDDGLKDWFDKYLTWLLESELGKKEGSTVNNHSVQYDVQITRIALFLNKTDFAKQILEKFPAERIFKQIEPDGSQPWELNRTNSFNYSVYNIMHLVDMACIAKTVGIDLLKNQSADGRSIEKSISFLLPYVGVPSSQWPYEQLSEWEKYQLLFAWSLFQTDNLNNSNTYKKYYTDSTSKYKSDIKQIIY